MKKISSIGLAIMIIILLSLCEIHAFGEVRQKVNESIDTVVRDTLVNTDTTHIKSIKFITSDQWLNTGPMQFWYKGCLYDITGKRIK